MSAKRIVQIVALVLALAAAVTILFLPGTAQVVRDDAGNERVVAVTSTLLEHAGPVLLGILAIPIGLTLAPVLLRGPAWPIGSIVFTVVLAVWTVVSSLGIGRPYFAPALIAAIVALFLPPRRP